MSKFLLDDYDYAKAIVTPWVFSENSLAKNAYLIYSVLLQVNCYPDHDLCMIFVLKLQIWSFSDSKQNCYMHVFCLTIFLSMIYIPIKEKIRLPFFFNIFIIKLIAPVYIGYNS